MHSYSIMHKCWKPQPEERPTFEELASILGKLLESSAGYMEINMALVANESKIMLILMSACL